MGTKVSRERSESGWEMWSSWSYPRAWHRNFECESIEVKHSDGKCFKHL